MKMFLALVGAGGRHGDDSFDLLLQRYLKRTQAYTEMELLEFRTEQAVFEKARREQGRTAPWVVLVDQRGRALSSEEFAASVRSLRDSGRQKVFFAIGPAGGWSPEARKQAQSLLSLGPMTLPHELAAVLVAEQIYRAFTILAGHPYHIGH